MITFEQAREAFINQADIQSKHTLDAYRRSVDLFLIYLDDRTFKPRLPVQSHIVTSAQEVDVALISPKDVNLLTTFARWLQTPAEGDKRRPYAHSTVELRLAGVLRWFEFLEKKAWLADDFPLTDASVRLREYLQNDDAEEPTESSEAITVEHDFAPLLSYYAQQTPPKHLQKQPDRLRRWELTRQRNQALIQVLAETGGQVSAILKLNTDLFLTIKRPMVVRIAGKSNHHYDITLDSSIPDLKAYLNQRGVSVKSADKTPLFVSHDPQYDGKRMSRVIAWRIVQRAAKAVSLPEVSPHHLRHWRAAQLIEAGADLETLQRQLGHRSAHTIRAYYGHLLPDDDSEAT